MYLRRYQIVKGWPFGIIMDVWNPDNVNLDSIYILYK